MAITLVQSNVQHNSGQTSVKTAFTSPVTTGNMIGIAIMTNAIASNAPTSVVDTNGDTLITALAWTKPGTGEGAVGIYLFNVGTGGSSFGITPTFAASTTWSAIVFEYSGVNSTPQDGSASTVGAGTSTSATCGNLTPAQSGDQQLAFIWSAATTPSWNNSLAQHQSNTTGTPNAFFADNNLSSTATATASATLAPSAQFNMAQILLAPAPSTSLTLVSSVTGNITGASGTYTLTESVSSNDMILVQWVLDNVGSAITPTISDGLNGAYTQIGSANFDSGGSKSQGQSWIACRSAGSAPVISIGPPGSFTNAQLLVSHYSGFSAVPIVDNTANITGTGTSITNSLNTNFSSELVVSNTFSGSTFTGTPTGWTSTLSGGNGSIDQTYYKALVSPTSVSLSGTLSVSSAYNNWLIGFASTPPSTTIPLGGPRRVQWHWR